MAYILKARIVEPEERSTAREEHGNNTWYNVFYAIRADN
jgi:hypothetical protein